MCDRKEGHAGTNQYDGLSAEKGGGKEVRDIVVKWNEVGVEVGTIIGDLQKFAKLIPNTKISF